jgi:hypothetical protein
MPYTYHLGMVNIAPRKMILRIMALSLPHEITMNIPWFIHVCPMVSSMFHPQSPWLITFISPTQIPYSKTDEIPLGLMVIKKTIISPSNPLVNLITMGINIISPS